jgi:hypothetical protein
LHLRVSRHALLARQPEPHVTDLLKQVSLLWFGGDL